MPRRFAIPYFSSCRLLVIPVVLVILLGTEVRAQPVPELAIVKIEEAEAPMIDGLLSDEVWKVAALIPNLTQQEPIEGAAPTERTEVRLCYDSRNLYVSFRCFDSEPDRINASIMQKDQTVGADDYVAVLIDPFETGREGYWFRMNPNGAKGEGRITELVNRVQMEWDAIWKGSAHRDESGWSCELAIPFRSLSFADEAPRWRMNFNRWIPRKQERNRWSGAVLSRRFTKLEDAGVITGFSGMERGLGIDVKPYGLGRWGDGASGDGWSSDFGGDVFWQVTPSLTTTFTVNTDFAEAEVDDRVVNLTRFPLFFPEKRDFFLEGSEFFEFGPFNSGLRAFHSRTVGLSADLDKVPILGGAKVTGREGPIGIGIFGAGLGDAPGLSEDEVGVSRLTYDLDDHSRAGGFFSYGDPRSNVTNWVAGMDYSFKNPHFRADQQLNVDFFELLSEDAGEQGHAFGMEVDYPNNPVAWRVGMRQIDEDFRPGLGFVRRPGTRQVDGFMRKRWYPEDIEWIRHVDVGGSVDVFTTLENEVETIRSAPIWVGAETEAGDELTVWPRVGHERLFETFEIADGVFLAPGSYTFTDFVADFETSNSRPVSVDVNARIGEFWDGTRWGVGGGVQWRASKFFGLEAEADFDEIDLGPGEFEVLVTSFGFRVTPNPKLSWNLIAQWDNISDEAGINSRIRWIVAPGNDIFLVINKAFEVGDDRSFKSLGSEFVTKVGWTFRY